MAVELNETKYTTRNFLENVAKGVCGDVEMAMAADLLAKRDIANRKRAEKPKKLTKTQEENVVLLERLRSMLTPDVQAADVFSTALNVTKPRMARLMKTLIDEGVAVKVNIDSERHVGYRLA